MDTSVINECTTLSLAEKITFPEVVMRLSASGVERYIADLVGQKKYSYGVNGQTHAQQLTFPAHTIAKQFDAAKVKSAIADIQQGRIQYQDFLQRIMEAGCSHYEVFIAGRRAVYFGRDGSQHIERFPQAA